MRDEAEHKGASEAGSLGARRCRDAEGVSFALAQVGYLARRSVVRTIRQPAYVVAPLVFPMMLLAVNSAGLDSATRLRGFPTDSFLAFALAVPFVQGALISTLNTASDLARDIQTGFLNRLSLTPMRGAALIAGHLGGTVAMGAFQALVYLLVGLSAGTTIEAGPLGILVLFVLAMLIALGFGALGTFVAIRTGSSESVQGFFPVFFVALFISSMNMPRNLIEADWFRAVATVNPVSYLIEGVRSLIIAGWDGQALALAFAVATALAIGGIALAASALPKRLTRT